jgi:hypothetical protein
MVTVSKIVSADGPVLLPIFIYKSSAHLTGWHAAVQKDKKATFAWLSKGWTNWKLGLEWVE